MKSPKKLYVYYHFGWFYLYNTQGKYYLYKIKLLKFLQKCISRFHYGNPTTHEARIYSIYKAFHEKKKDFKKNLKHWWFQKWHLLKERANYSKRSHLRSFFSAQCWRGKKSRKIQNPCRNKWFFFYWNFDSKKFDFCVLCY